MNPNLIFHKNYTIDESGFQLKLPLEISALIPNDDSVRLLSRIVEEMDLRDLYATYSRIRKNQADPRTLLKILIYAYSQGIYSSRSIETSCRRDINFMYLLNEAPAPDHSTIARFRTLHFSQCAASLMAQFTDFLHDIGEMSGEELFLDGTKIEAQANKYTFVWKRAASKSMEKTLRKASELVLTCVLSYGLTPPKNGSIRLHYLKRLRKKLYAVKGSEGICFVHGIGHRKTTLQKQIELLEHFISKLKEYVRKIYICGERNSYSKTDPDATFMRMKEDYMRNGQLKPGYNIQFGVDSGYIAWASVSWHPTDTSTLSDFMDGMHARLDHRYQTLVADAGYESEENYTYLEENHVEAVIKPNNYEISQTRKYRKDISRKENMTYNPDGDYYTCQNGKHLWAIDIRTRKTKSGYRRRETTYRCEDCSACPFKSQCIRGNHWKRPEEERTKQLRVSRKFERQRSACLERITSDRGKMLRLNRTIQSEGTFAVCKEDAHFRRFLCRGRENVYAEILLLAMAHNVNELHRKIQGDRRGSHLYPLKTA